MSANPADMSRGDRDGRLPADLFDSVSAHRLVARPSSCCSNTPSFATGARSRQSTRSSTASTSAMGSSVAANRPAVAITIEGIVLPTSEDRARLDQDSNPLDALHERLRTEGR